MNKLKKKKYLCVKNISKNRQKKLESQNNSNFFVFFCIFFQKNKARSPMVKCIGFLYKFITRKKITRVKCCIYY